MAQDILQQLRLIRENSLNSLEAKHQELLHRALQRLEQEVVTIASSLPMQESALFNTRLAIEIRPKLQRAIEELYLKPVQTFINDYDKIAGNIVATYGKLSEQIVNGKPLIPVEFKSITEADLVTIQQLKKLAFTNFQNLGTEFTNTLAQEIYQSTLVGRSAGEMVQTIRDKINGIYQYSDNAKAQQLVEYITNNPNGSEVATAIDELKQNYGRTSQGDSFVKYASLIVQDSIMGFDGQFAKYRADEVGLTSYLYYGSLIKDSRDFCRIHAGKVYNEEQISQIWSNDSAQGRDQGSPFIVRGGYNCRHSWQPVDPSWIDENGESTI
jgi:hypothetical protein